MTIHMSSLPLSSQAELPDADLDDVSGGFFGFVITTTQNMTNGQQTTAQKAAEKADSYIRS